MLKEIIKKYIAEHKNRPEHQSVMRWFGKLVHHPSYWTVNKHSVATGFSVGLFAALVPLPAQTLIAIFLGILLKANLPVSVGLTWVSNPFTTPFIAYFCYKVGAITLGRPELYFDLNIEFTLDWLMKKFHSIGIPFLVGSLIVAVATAIITNILIRVIWRICIILKMRKRKKLAEGRNL